jgi:hypothetical protein
MREFSIINNLPPYERGVFPARKGQSEGEAQFLIYIYQYLTLFLSFAKRAG